MNSSLAIATLLRRHSALKQRKGMFNNTPTDFFRYKRFLRALQSNEYKNRSARQPDLYPPVFKKPTIQEEKDNEDELVVNEDACKKIFIMLIQQHYILPVIKLDSAQLKKQNLKPNKDYPFLQPTDKAHLEPDQYYVWNFNVKTWWDYLIVVGIIAFILLICCYPLWPRSMRLVSYYISLSALWILIGFFVIAIIRLIIAILSYPVTKDGLFWLFPNFFEDCGVVDSFKPLYGWGDKETYSYQKKLKRKQRKEKKLLEAKEKTATEKVPKTTTESKKPLLEDVEED